jgi:cytochrome bd ubiquinol oxidase subunit I
MACNFGGGDSHARISGRRAGGFVVDTLTAARLQMTLSLAFHIVFAAVGIGLPLLLVIAEGLWLRTGAEHYRSLAKRWAKATGILFAVGAVSGTALAFELGLLWPRYLELTGAVVGHVFGLEGYAFFVEAIFIGLYLYGWDRLRPRAHWWCGVAVAVSGMLSGVLVLGVNAWMQQPVGFALESGRVVVTDPVAIFKRPGWFYMALHSTLSCYIAVAFLVAGVYAADWLRGRRDAAPRSAILAAMAVGAITAVAQPLSGDLLSKFVFQTQPAKFAAMEGQFRTERAAPLRIGGWPDADAGATRWAVEIPGGLSFLATHDPGAEVPGLDQVPRSDWPNVELTHLAFQAMVAIGGLLVAVSAWFWAAYWRRGEAALGNRLLLWAVALCGPLGFVALEAGWVVTEVGRQPWVINGVLRTSEAVTPAAGVPLMFYGFAVLYLVLGGTVALSLWNLRAPDPAAARAPQEAPPGA